MLSLNQWTTRAIQLLLLAGILLSTEMSFAEDKPEAGRAQPVLMAQLGHTSWLRSAVFSPDGTQVLSASGDKTARLWETATGKELRRFEGHSPDVHSAVFSPDGAQVLTGSHDETARLWETATGKELRRFEGHSMPLTSAVFSADGAQVLTGSQDQTARLWETATGKELRRFEGHRGWVWSAVFSADGTRVLTAGGDVSRFPGAFKIAGKYVTKDGTTTATFKLRRGRKALADWIEVSGKADALPALIVAAARKHLP